GASYKETVDVRNVASGMYLVEVENGGIKQVQKVIKQ
ncbi:MAG: T9SS type A sorting domain-containing protein, partial [Candidatus Kapabacteria bacterium]|nr:T9SS type A sorting domain-containing protein [Candidatus Kapabacteria bacterium]